MSKKRELLEQNGRRSLSAADIARNVQGRQQGGNPGMSAVNLMARKLQQMNPGVVAFDVENKTIAGVPFTDYGLDIPNDISRDQFDQLADVLLSLEGRLAIYIGDMLNKMDDLEYGDITELAHRFGREPDTFFKYKSVMKTFTTLIRIKVYEQVPTYKRTLSLGHYALVQSLESVEPDKREAMRIELLVEALRDGLSVAAFRTHVQKRLGIKTVRTTKEQRYSRTFDEFEGWIVRQTKDDKRAAIQRLQMMIEKIEEGL